MKKYHIADILTLLRAIIGVVIFGLTFLIREPLTGLILVLFSFGELTDALDGEFARRYPYPRDRTKRWWRKYNDDFDLYQYELNDIYADLIIGLATLVYVVKWINPFFGGLYLGAAVAVGLFVLFSIEASEFNESYRFETMAAVEKIREKLILRRRGWYGAGIAVVVLTLIIATRISAWLKLIMILVGAIVGFCILQLKRSTRLKEDKTPL